MYDVGVYVVVAGMYPVWPFVQNVRTFDLKVDFPERPDGPRLRNRISQCIMDLVFEPQALSDDVSGPSRFDSQKEHPSGVIVLLCCAPRLYESGSKQCKV